ncbi:MAG TPA: hypothetical protein VFQ19_17610 [Nocardioidaceae bacterium]|nr:hypothetical protein [Nocardioidaceae bacterium]
MTGLHKIAMGLVIVVVDAYFGEFDAVPDVLGWILVLLGLRDLRGRVTLGGLVALATAAAAVSVVLLWPDLLASASESTLWALSLPQIAFSILLCGAATELCAPSNSGRARQFTWLRWVFIVLAFAPAVLYGAGADVLEVPIAVTTVAANVALIYLLFRLAGRTADAR